jgi:phosphoglycerol transferase MdoB-like AlkP superfamily enzyme
MGGEGRELCGRKIAFKLMTLTPKDMHACLPNQLASEGYHTLSVHGLDGHMFKREDWYPRAGFEEDVFRDDLEQENLPDCVGAFTGTCDAAIADWIGRRLKMATPKPNFVYWVTLNSHLPVPVPSPLQNGAPCAGIASLAGKPPLCSWYQLVENVHQSVVKLALSKLARPTVFIIVGDHAPPFGEGDIRRGFSQTVVPYMILLPRPEGKMKAEVH